MGFCKICHHPQVAEIDEAYASGEPKAAIEKRFGLRLGALNFHVRNKHVAESPDDLDEEPYIIDGRGSYDWIVSQSKARAVKIDKLLGETRGYDPFFFGSETDIAEAKWFRDEVVRRFESPRPHLRKLHYLCVTAAPPVLWPDGRVYENTIEDWIDLLWCSRKARWLEYVNIEEFDDQRNAAPDYFATDHAEESDEPSAEAALWPDWELPEIDANLGVEKWFLPNVTVDGYESDSFLDKPFVVGVFIEKSTMSGWLRPLCRDLEADLYVGSGTQSITSAVRFIRRAADLEKSAHLLVISDFDPTGRRMPIAASRHVDYRRRMPSVNCEQWITVDQIALTPEQVAKYGLPRKPIKKTDPGKRHFEKNFGDDAVELDALEALHPGALEIVVEDAIRAFDDGDIDRRLSLARDGAGAFIEETFEGSDAYEIQDRVGKLWDRLDAIITPIEKELRKLRRRLNAGLKPIKAELKELRAEAEDAVEDVVSEIDASLPDRPAPEENTGLPDGVEHLFDSERTYFENVASLHRFYPPVEKKPRRKPKK